MLGEVVPFLEYSELFHLKDSFSGATVRVKS
jgi:hypothetical protein